MLAIILPYKKRGYWVFDDSSEGFFEEKISGGDFEDLIDQLTSSISNAHKGFTLSFSTIPFDGNAWLLKRKQDESGYLDEIDDFYYCSKLDRNFYLPSFFRDYLDNIDDNFYILAEPKSLGKR